MNVMRFKAKPSFDIGRKFNNVTASWNLVKLTKYFLVIGLIIALVFSCLWYSRVYMNSERRFWSAVENSMSTRSVVRTLSEGGSGNQVVQDYRFHFSPQQVIENRVDFKQKSATTDTEVVTEGIIFPQEQFLRYTKFRNDTNGEEGANLDSVLGEWANQGSGAGEAEEARLNYLSEYVTLAVFGNFNAQQRAELINNLRQNNVYDVDFNNVLEDELDGEDVKIYQVTVNLRPFAELLNEAFVMAGYGDFPPLNPENYREGSTLKSVFKVAGNNSIVGINFGNRNEVYSNYGVIKIIERPEADMTINELQNEVQSIIQ